MVEYPVHTRYVICSSQIAATRPVGQAVKTPPFHGGNMGSIPVRVTKNLLNSFRRFFLISPLLTKYPRGAILFKSIPVVPVWRHNSVGRVPGSYPVCHLFKSDCRYHSPSASAEGDFFTVSPESGRSRCTAPPPASPERHRVSRPAPTGPHTCPQQPP